MKGAGSSGDEARRSRPQRNNGLSVERLCDVLSLRPLVFLGAGSELRGDDAWAFRFITNLKNSAPAGVRCLWGGTVPENMVKPVAALSPSAVVICDSGDLQREPGSLGLFSPDELGDEVPFSHRMPATMLAAVLRERTRCAVHFLLMQPENLEFAMELSPRVARATRSLLSMVRKTLAADRPGRGKDAAGQARQE